MAPLGAGPQLTIGQGPLRFYGFATIGGSLLWSSATYGCGGSGSDAVFHGQLTSDLRTAAHLRAGPASLIRVRDERLLSLLEQRDLRLRVLRFRRVSERPPDF